MAKRIGENNQAASKASEMAKAAKMAWHRRKRGASRIAPRRAYNGEGGGVSARRAAARCRKRRGSGGVGSVSGQPTLAYAYNKASAHHRRAATAYGMARAQPQSTRGNKLASRRGVTALAASYGRWYRGARNIGGINSANGMRRRARRCWLRASA